MAHKNNFILKKTNLTEILAYFGLILHLQKRIKLLVWNFQETCETILFFLKIGLMGISIMD